jgi:hypothetical protein
MSVAQQKPSRYGGFAMQDKQGSLFEFEAGAVNQYGYPIGGSDPTVHHIPDPRKLVRRSDPATSQAAATIDRSRGHSPRDC